MTTEAALEILSLYRDYLKGILSGVAEPPYSYKPDAVLRAIAEADLKAAEAVLEEYRRQIWPLLHKKWGVNTNRKGRIDAADGIVIALAQAYAPLVKEKAGRATY